MHVHAMMNPVFIDIAQRRAACLLFAPFSHGLGICIGEQKDQGQWKSACLQTNYDAQQQGYEGGRHSSLPAPHPRQPWPRPTLKGANQSGSGYGRD